MAIVYRITVILKRYREQGQQIPKAGGGVNKVKAMIINTDLLSPPTPNSASVIIVLAQLHVSGGLLPNADKCNNIYT